MKKVITIFMLLAIFGWSKSMAQNAWTARASFPNGSRELAAGFSIGTMGYLGTGDPQSSDMWKYNSVSNTWTQIADLPTASNASGRYGAVGFSIGNKGYMGTGYDLLSPYSKDFYEYDTTTNVWTQKADFGGIFGQGRQGAIGFSIGNKGYIGTGQSSSNFNDFYEYDPALDTWTLKANYPGIAGPYHAAFSIGNKGYVGTGTNGTNSREFYEFNPATNTWTPKASFPGTSRHGSVGFSINSFGYMGGGLDSSGAYKSDFWQYNPAFDNWVQIANEPGTYAYSVGFSIGSNGYVGTGKVQSVFVSAFNEYTPPSVTVDAALIALIPAAGTPASFALVNTGVTISGTIKNNGINNITSCLVKCSDGITLTSYSFNGNIAPADSAPFTATNLYMMPATASMHNVSVWVELQGDQNHANDTLRTILTSALFTPSHKVTFEAATGTWNGFSPRNIVYLDSMRIVNPSSTELINVHNADPMVVTAYDAGETSFPGFSGFPYIIVDRKSLDDPSNIFTEYTNHLNDFGVADISVSPTYNTQTHILTVVASAHFAVPINPNNGNYRLALVVTEDSVHGTSTGYDQHNYYSGGGYGPMHGGGYDFVTLPSVIPSAQMYYQFVARTIAGTYTGSPSSLPQTIAAGSTQVFTFQYTVPTSSNFSHMKAIVLLINTTTGQIMNSNDGNTPCTISNVSINVNGPTTACNLDTVILSTGSYSAYHWTTSATTQSTGYLLVQQTTTYTVTVTDSSGCTGTASQLITINHTPDQPGPIQGDTSVCPGTQQTYSIAAVTGATDYTWTVPNGWTGSSTSTSITVTVNSQGGNISVTANNACGSSIARTMHISILSGSVTIGGNTIPANCGPNGTVMVHIVSGLGPFTYSWSPISSQNSTITGLNAGNYTCTVYGNNGCSATIVLTVTATNNAPPMPGPIQGNVTPCTGTQQTYSIAPVLGATYYIWMLPNGWSGSSTTQSITVTVGNTSGVISVIAGNNCDTSGAQTLQVTIGNLNPTIYVSGPSTFCNGDSTMLYVTSAFSYQWSTGATSQTIHVTTGGTYSVTVSGANGCTGVASQVITVNQAPDQPGPINGDTLVCPGSQQTYSIAPVSGAFGYTWSVPNGWSANTTVSTSINVIVGNSGGVISVTAIDSCGNSIPQAIQVTVGGINAVITANGPTTFCQGGSVGLMAGQFDSYIWNTGATTDTISVNTSGTFSVTVSNNNGCTGTASIVVTVNQNPIDSIIAYGPTTFCQGGSVILDAGLFASYHWSIGSATTQTVTITQTGNYRVTISNSDGCTATASQLVNVNANPSPTIAGGPTTFCDGGSVILDAGLFSSYAWSNGGTDETITVFTSGNYIVTVTNSNNCSASVSQVVTVNANPTPSITPSGPTTFCQGGSVGLDAGSYASYHWSTNATTESITAISTNNYMVTVTNGNGCTGIASVFVIANQNPTPNIVANGLTTFCSGGSVMLDVGAWVTYQWNINSTAETINVSTTGAYLVTITDANGCTGMASQTVTVYSNPTPSITGIGSICDGNSTTLSAGTFTSYDWSTNNTAASISVTTSGTYSVTVTDNLGCTGSASRVVTVNQNPTPSITPNGPTTFCNGGSVILNAGSYSSYNWTNGATTQTISVTTSGHFMVTVTDINGCTGIAMLNVTVNSTPSPTITPSGATTFCEGGSVTLDAGTWVSYIWNTGNTSESITVFGSQPYCVSVTDGNGCTGYACQFVTVYAHPIPTIIPNGPTTFCTGGSVTLNAGTYPSYLWNTGATTATITSSNTGVYMVTVSNINNCTASASISVSVHTSPSPVITANGPTNLCQGGMVTLDAGLYAAYHWMNSQTTETLLVLSSGNYVVTVTGNNGCTGTASQVVNVTPFINPTISASGPTQICGGSVTLDAGVYNTYHWSNGATTETITTSTSGLYIVTVFNAGNCSGTAQRTVTSYSSPVPNILVTHLNNLCGGGYVWLNVGATFPSYIWSDGATTQLDSVNAGGVYTVTVTNANGCTGSASTTITGTCAIPVIAAIPTTNIGSTYAMANWIQPSCHVGYKVRVSVHNVNAWVYHTILPNSHYTMSQLMHNTSYDWEVQTNCNANQTSVSGYSAPQTFTTLARLEGEQDASTIGTFSIYPNPANDQATIVFASDKEEVCTIRLMDITGRVVLQYALTSVVGENQYQMNLSEISKGIYLVILQKEDAVLKTKLVVN